MDGEGQVFAPLYTSRHLRMRFAVLEIHYSNGKSQHDDGRQPEPAQSQEREHSSTMTGLLEGHRLRLCRSFLFCSCRPSNLNQAYIDADRTMMHASSGGERPYVHTAKSVSVVKAHDDSRGHLVHVLVRSVMYAQFGSLRPSSRHNIVNLVANTLGIHNSYS